jgi:hypothetical protein
MINTYKILRVKLGGKRPFARSRCSWKDNIKMNLKGEDYGDVDWIHVAQDRNQYRDLLNTAMHFLFP